MKLSFALAIAAVSGFVALSYEILWYRVIAFASWGLPGAFGLLLAAYLFGLACGARIAGLFCKDDVKPGDPKQLRMLAIFAFVANVVAWSVVPVFGLSAKRWDWPPALVVVALAAALLGAILPLVSHFGIAADDKAGAKLSYVYLANIVGSAAGSLFTGFVLLDAFRLHEVGIAIACVGLALVGLLVAPTKQRNPALFAVVAVTLIVTRATPIAYDRIWERLLYKKDFAADTRFAEVIETKSGVITVTEDGTVYGGGAYDGRFNTSITNDRNGILRAYGISAMHPAPKRILMIGLASGSWATVISRLEGVDSLTIVEINPGYVALVSRHEEVSGILRDPKVKIVTDDGRRWLHRHDDLFDVIVMNTTWHWRAHITNLLSTEFMELARAHLAPGGIFYFNTTSSADVQRTAATLFPHAMRVYNFMAVSDAPLAFDKDRWARTLDRLDLDAKAKGDLLAYADTIDAKPALDHGLEPRNSVLARTQAALVVTDDNMAPEWREVLRFQEPP